MWLEAPLAPLPWYFYFALKLIFQIFLHEMSLFLPGAQDDIYKLKRDEK